MMKLEVGMYVRHKPLLSSKYVKINKIKEIEEKENCLHIWLEDKDLITEKYLIKASYNIIDILGVGDVIIDKEGHKYLINYEFETDYNGEYNSYEITIDDHITLFFKDGLSIVTHEQMEQMAYKVWK